MSVLSAPDWSFCRMLMLLSAAAPQMAQPYVIIGKRIMVTGEDRGCSDFRIADTLRDAYVDYGTITSTSVWNVSGVTRSMNFVTVNEGVSE
ncbi:hypothetical protein NPIL_648461 [Nephila pilipes]|uniref:Uncharacterized protein n=1 Tax=Nephila pilipes TaxID=299642 RepID=A0A8X6MH55_NEPPI|nr:hypothetical protein NPIL_648461 [Nephila pilipes]